MRGRLRVSHDFALLAASVNPAASPSILRLTNEAVHDLPHAPRRPDGDHRLVREAPLDPAQALDRALRPYARSKFRPSLPAWPFHATRSSGPAQIHFRCSSHIFTPWVSAT